MNSQGDPGSGGRRGRSMSNLHLNSSLWGCSPKLGVWGASSIHGTWGPFQNTELPCTSPPKSGVIFIQMNLNTDDLNAWAIWGHCTGTLHSPSFVVAKHTVTWCHFFLSSSSSHLTSSFFEAEDTLPVSWLRHPLFRPQISVLAITKKPFPGLFP